MYQWWCISVCHKFLGYSLIHRRPTGGPSTELWDFGSPPRATVPWHFMAFPSKIRCPVSGFPEERVSGRVCLTLRLRIEKSLMNAKNNAMACVFWTSSCIAMYRRWRSSSHRHQHIAFLRWTLISHTQSLIRLPVEWSTMWMWGVWKPLDGWMLKASPARVSLVSLALGLDAENMECAAHVSTLHFLHQCRQCLFLWLHSCDMLQRFAHLGAFSWNCVSVLLSFLAAFEGLWHLWWSGSLQCWSLEIF